jgi:2,4-didehydro-3-deoxy-L-rhamnonate hydrolase
MFGIGTFRYRDATPYAGVVYEDAVTDLRPHFGGDVTVRELLERWGEALPELHGVAASRGRNTVPLADVSPCPPIDPPGQIFCAGANFRRHTLEMTYTVQRDLPGETRSDAELWEEAEKTVARVYDQGMPFMFAAIPSAVSGASDEVVLWGPGIEHDWEVELTVVIGATARNVSPAEAMEYVAGYTISNDISTRDVMFRPGFLLSDFMRSKLRPTFFPTGPFIVPREFVPDYRSLRITMRLNGELMQDETVDDIIYGVEDLVAYASSVTTLQPGDLILTGSPGGNAGIHGNRWLKPGDVIEAEIAGLGNQRNLCVADAGAPMRIDSGARRHVRPEPISRPRSEETR